MRNVVNIEACNFQYHDKKHSSKPIYFESEIDLVIENSSFNEYPTPSNSNEGNVLDLPSILRSVEILNSEFNNCGQGGNVINSQASVFSIIDSQISFNRSIFYSRGLYVSDLNKASTYNIEHSNFEKCSTSTGNGGSILFEFTPEIDSTLTIDGSEFSDNSANEGHSIYISGSGSENSNIIIKGESCFRDNYGLNNNGFVLVDV